MLRQSDHVVIARDSADEPLAGFVTAISDGVLAAYITFLEVRREHRGRGIGTDLVTRLLGLLDQQYMVDVVCDEDVLPFYQRLGFVRVTGAVIRRPQALVLCSRRPPEPPR